MSSFKVPLDLFILPANESGDLRNLAIDPLPRRKHLDPPISGYRDYLLFALRTRILPDIQSVMGRNIIVSFTNYPGASLNLSYTSDKEPQMNETLTSEITALINKQVNLPYDERLECLLIKWNSVRYLTPPTGSSGVQDRIPGKWLRSILPFIPDFMTDPSLPKVSFRDDALYADCLKTSDSDEEYFTDLYSRMTIKVLDLIKQWYIEGRIVDPQDTLVKDWKLVPAFPGKNLFKPEDDWGISKLSRGSLIELPVSGLLYDLAKGKERSVSVRVGINLVNYHAISQKLLDSENCHFAAGALHFIPKSLDNLLFVINTVDQVLYGGEVSGAVFTLSSTRLSWIRVFSLITRRSVSTDLAIYVRKDLEPEIVFSAKIPINSNISELRREVLLRSRRLLLFLMKKLETKDIHAALDNPETQLPEVLSSPTAKQYMKDEGILF